MQEDKTKEQVQAMQSQNINHSYEKAKSIGLNRRIKTFEELNADFDGNVFLTKEDEEFLKKLQED